MVVDLSQDLRLALDRVAFAQALGLAPDRWQEDLLRSTSKRVLLNCCRQSGKSTMAALIALHRGLYHPGSVVLLLAPALRQSQELYAKVASFYRASGRTVPASSETALRLTLENGSRIISLPGKDDASIRGYSADLLVCDEASRISDDLYYSTRPMLSVSGGAMLALSTPWGRRGWWHEEWSNGTGWERYEIPASMCPRISEEFLEEERASLPPRVYRQEYECSFEETEDMVFSYEQVARAITDEVKPLFR
jgi:Terminase large subunit, T4likevirus-type, N-terminal